MYRQHLIAQAAEAGDLDLRKIEGMTEAAAAPQVLRYAQTGALQFWVAGNLMNEWVRQLDYQELLKNALAASIAGHTASGWLQNLDFNALPKDLLSYYQRAGGTYQNLDGARAIWETIPALIRTGGEDALRKFHAERDWSHIVPRSLGGGNSASEGIFENASLNRTRGNSTMTGAELDAARQALGMEALRHAVTQAAQVAVVSGLTAAIVEGVFATMEEGLLYFDGEIDKREFYSRVLKRLRTSVAHAVVISGLIVGLVTLCPVLIPVLELLALPLAIASFTLLGIRFYHLNREWWQRVSLDPSLPAELLPDWFRNWTWEPVKSLPGQALEAGSKVRESMLNACRRVSGAAKDAFRATKKTSQDALEWAGEWFGGKICAEKDASRATKKTSQDALEWAGEWFGGKIWEAQDAAESWRLTLESLRSSTGGFPFRSGSGSKPETPLLSE